MVSSSRKLYLVLLIPILISLLAWYGWRNDQGEALISGAPLERVLRAGEIHRYRMWPREGFLEELELTQLNADLCLTVKDVVTGEIRFDWDGPYGHVGKELICFQVDQDGLYEVSVSSFEEDEVGRYRLERRSERPSPEGLRRLEAFQVTHRAVSSRDGAESIALLKEAQHAWLSAGDPEQACMVLWRRAQRHNELFQVDEAVEAFQGLVSMLEPLEQPNLKAMARYYLADALVKRGRFEDARTAYLVALEGFEAPDRNRADVLESLGKLHYFMGADALAESYILKALDIQKGLNHPGDMASILAGIGWLEHRAGNSGSAVRRLREGLALVPPDSKESIKLNQYLAIVLEDFGEYWQALNYLEVGSAYVEPGSFQEGGNTIATARNLLRLGRCFEAETLLSSALARFEAYPHIWASVARLKAEVHAGFLETPRAIQLMERVVSRLDETFGAGVDQVQRVQQVFPYSDFLLDLYIAEGRHEEAFSLAVARGLVVTRPMNENEEARRKLSGLANEISTLAWQERNAQTYSMALTHRLDAYKHLSEMVAPVYDHQSRIAALQSRDLTSLFYVMGESSVYVWVIQKGERHFYRLGDRPAIERAVNRYVWYMTERPYETEALRRIGRDLSRQLMDPLQVPLASSRLQIIPDGVLWRLPFESLLTASGEYLGGAYQFIHGGIVGDMEPRQGSGNLLVVANPRYGEAFPELPGSEREAKMVAKQAGAQGLKTRFLLGAEANRKALFQELHEARIIHFATHGVSVQGSDELSALVLSTVDRNGAPVNGYLRPGDIVYQRLSADLVVLSACDLGGGTPVRGLGLMGFASAFLQAGASAVVAGRWRVHDDAAAYFMNHFYRAYLQEQSSPAEALRVAQLAMMQHPRWNGPHYWAGFILYR